MLSVLKFVIYYPTIVATVLFLLWMALRYVWHSIRLPFISPAEIERVTDEFLARHGPRAQEIAAIEEEHAWRYFNKYRLSVMRREE